jgi:hypothetical protein
MISILVTEILIVLVTMSLKKELLEIHKAERDHRVDKNRNKLQHKS